MVPIDFVYLLVMALIKRMSRGMCDGWGFLGLVACKLGSQTEYPASAFYTYTVFSRKYSFYISFNWEMFVVPVYGSNHRW